MKKSIKKNYIYNFLYQILFIIAPLITTPYVSRILGASGIGEVSFVESIASYFALFATLGITTYGQREISYCQNDINKRSKVFFNTFFLKIITSLLFLVLYLAFCRIYFKSILYIVFSFSIVAVFFDITWFFQGMEEFGIIVLRNSIFRILSVVLIFVMVKSKQDMFWYAIILSSFTLICNISLFPLLKDYIVFVKITEIKPFKDIRTVLELFLPTVAIQVYTVLDKTMIGIITKDYAENGYYEQSIKITKTVITFLTALGTVVAPRVGMYFEKKDYCSIKKLMYNSYRFVWFLGLPLCFGLIAVSDNLVPLFLGAGFDKSIILIKILSVIIIVIGLSNVTGIQLLVPTKRQNLLTISLCIGAIINLILNLFFIRIYKSIGAAFASVIAEVVITIIQFIFVRNDISLLKVFSLIIKYLISSIIMSIIIFILKINSINNLFVLIAVGICSYVLLLLIQKENIFKIFINTD